MGKSLGENSESQEEKGKLLVVDEVIENGNGWVVGGGVFWGYEVGNSPLKMFGMCVVHPTWHMTMLLGHLTEKQGSAACLPPEHMLRSLSESTAWGIPTCRAVEKHNRQCVTEVQNHGPASSYTFD